VSEASPSKASLANSVQSKASASQGNEAIPTNSETKANEDQKLPVEETKARKQNEAKRKEPPKELD
jgi:hypothetical protein